MSCSILTAERLEALLAGKLVGADRAAVAEHLKAPCETCLDALGSVDGGRILAALAGEGADLSAAEADRMFEAAVPGAVRERPASGPIAPQSFWEKVIEWLGGATWRPALGVAVLLLVAAPVVLLGGRAGTGPGGYDGLKAGPGSSAGALKANLIGVIGGRFHGEPFISRRAAQREQLRPGEVLLVRFRLTTSAAVHLDISGPKMSAGVWPNGFTHTNPQPPMLPPGEHALVFEKEALSIPTQTYGSPTRVMLIASPKPFPSEFDFWKVRDHPEALASVCPDCVADFLEVLPPPDGVEPEESFR